MINRTTLALVACLLTVTLTCEQSALANSNAERDARFADKVKAGINKIGVGPSARVNLKLVDKTELSGYVSKIEESSFVVTDLKTGASTVVAYPDVVKVKGNNLSTGAKIAIVAAIVGAIILILFIKKYCDNEGGC